MESHQCLHYVSSGAGLMNYGCARRGSVYYHVEAALRTHIDISTRLLTFRPGLQAHLFMSYVILLDKRNYFKKLRVSACN